MTATTLAERAAAAAARVNPDAAPAATPTTPAAAAGAAARDFTDYEPSTGAEGDPEIVPVHIAWMRVMREVTHIAKGGEGGQYKGGSSGNYDFRGIDRTVNAFGPACRKHGVMIIPIKTEVQYRMSQSKGGATCRECTATVTWAIKGPGGDVLDEHPQTVGEALDYSDKATTKAQSVAERTLLLVLGLVPTNDPDPDSSYIERGNEAAPTPHAYLAEITNPMTSHDRMRQIYNELGTHRLMQERVEYDGMTGGLGDLLKKVVSERWPKPGASTTAGQQSQRPAVEHFGHADGEFSPDCAGCKAEQAEADRLAAGGA